MESSGVLVESRCGLCEAWVRTSELERHVREELDYAAWRCRLCHMELFTRRDARLHFTPPFGAHPPRAFRVAETLDLDLERRVRQALGHDHDQPTPDKAPLPSFLVAKPLSAFAAPPPSFAAQPPSQPPPQPPAQPTPQPRLTQLSPAKAGKRDTSFRLRPSGSDDSGLTGSSSVYSVDSDDEDADDDDVEEDVTKPTPAVVDLDTPPKEISLALSALAAGLSPARSPARIIEQSLTAHNSSRPLAVSTPAALSQPRPSSTGPSASSAEPALPTEQPAKVAEQVLVTPTLPPPQLEVMESPSGEEELPPASIEMREAPVEAGEEEEEPEQEEPLAPSPALVIEDSSQLVTPDKAVEPPAVLNQAMEQLGDLSQDEAMDPSETDDALNQPIEEVLDSPTSPEPDHSMTDDDDDQTQDSVSTAYELSYSAHSSRSSTGLVITEELPPGSPVAEEEDSPVAEEDSPVAEEDSPVTEEDSPAAEEEDSPGPEVAAPGSPSPSEVSSQSLVLDGEAAPGSPAPAEMSSASPEPEETSSASGALEEARPDTPVPMDARPDSPMETSGAEDASGEEETSGAGEETSGAEEDASGAEEEPSENAEQDAEEEPMEEAPAVVKAETTDCGLCGLSVEVGKTKEHVLSVHMAANAFRCRLCGHSAKAQKDALKHLATAHGRSAVRASNLLDRSAQDLGASLRHTARQCFGNDAQLSLTAPSATKTPSPKAKPSPKAPSPQAQASPKGEPVAEPQIKVEEPSPKSKELSPKPKKTSPKVKKASPEASKAPGKLAPPKTGPKKRMSVAASLKPPKAKASSPAARKAKTPSPRKRMTVAASLKPPKAPCEATAGPAPPLGPVDLSQTLPCLPGATPRKPLRAGKPKARTECSECGKELGGGEMAALAHASTHLCEALFRCGHCAFETRVWQAAAIRRHVAKAHPDAPNDHTAFTDRREELRPRFAQLLRKVPI